MELDVAADREGPAEIGIQRQGSVEHAVGLGIGLRAGFPIANAAAQEPIMGLAVGGVLAAQPVLLSIRELYRQGRDDFLDNLVLQFENVIQGAVMAFGPDVMTALCVY